MRARELRDVVEVLILPSLERAIEELTKKNGSRRKARLLVGQSVQHLRDMMVRDKQPEEAPIKPAGPRLGIEIQRDAAKGADPVALNTGL